MRTAIDLRNCAVATSGSYRNFIEFDRATFSHIIDPRTGYPISNGAASVTVIADTCTFADGLATSLMVMAPEKGLNLLNRLDGVEGLIIVEQTDGSLADFYSKGFKALN